MTDQPNDTSGFDESLPVAWERMGVIPAGWRLADGTAVVLYYGHRRSIDLDWYTPVDAVDEAVLDDIETAGVTTLKLPGLDRVY